MATIRKRNDRWQVQVRRRGAPKLSKSFLLKADAVAWAREMEIAADRGSLWSDPRALEAITLGDLVTRYMTEVSARKRGAESELCYLRAFLRHSLCQRSLASLRPRDFADYRDELHRTITGSSVNRRLAVLRHIFEVAKSEWETPLISNPVASIKRPANNPPRERRLRQGELERLLAAAEKSRSDYAKPIIVLAVETAMRRGEILNISRADIDFHRSLLRIPDTKTGVPRTIPLTSTASDVLRKRIAGLDAKENKLFGVSANAFRLTWVRITRRAKIDDLHFHDLRHEAVSRYFEAGLGVAHVAAISGHKDFKMLARYTHVNVAAIQCQLNDNRLQSAALKEAQA